MRLSVAVAKDKMAVHYAKWCVRCTNHVHHFSAYVKPRHKCDPERDFESSFESELGARAYYFICPLSATKTLFVSHLVSFAQIPIPF